MHVILDWLNNPVILTVITLVFGLLVKYSPKLASVPNAAIPYLNALIALLVKLGAASTGPDVHSASYAVAGFAVVGFGGTFLGGLLVHAGSAAWQSVISSVTYEVFLRHPIAATKA